LFESADVSMHGVDSGVASLVGVTLAPSRLPPPPSGKAPAWGLVDVPLELHPAEGAVQRARHTVPGVSDFLMAILIEVVVRIGCSPYEKNDQPGLDALLLRNPTVSRNFHR
jgi:hypothetical protein